MARVSPSTLEGKAFKVKVLDERIEEGQLVLTLGEVEFNRRSPWYWYYIVKAAFILGKEVIDSRFRTN